MAEPADVVVIGAGVTGLALAWELRRAGSGRVVVLDKGYSGGGGSGRNVGRVRAMQLTPELTRFALAAQRKHRRLGRELGVNTLYWKAGYAWVFYDEAEMGTMAGLVPMLRSEGVVPRLLHGAEVTRRLPVLRGGEPPVGAMEGGDGIVHHDAVMHAYRSAAVGFGVELREGEAVTGIIKTGGRVAGVFTERGEVSAPIVVNAAGGWSAQVAEMAGVSIPNRPVRREVLVTEAARPFMRQAITFYRPMEGWFNQTLRGELVAGVTDPGERYGLEQGSSHQFLTRTASVVTEKAPRLAHLRVIRQWAGVYDMTPDRLPLVGPSPLPGFFQANGYSGRGFAFAPLVAELLAGWLVGRTRPDLLTPFDPARFGAEQGDVVIGDYYQGYISGGGS